MRDFDHVLLAARAGAAWAFTELWQQFSGSVVGYARARQVSDPDEVTSEVFLNAFTRLDSFEGDEPAFRSWLFTIAHRRCVDDLRRLSRQGFSQEYHTDIDPRQTASAEDEALSSLGTAAVRAAIEGLSPDQRDVLLLRVLGDLTVEQVAGVLGKRTGAVKALQRRALAALRRHLNQAVTI